MLQRYLELLSDKERQAYTIAKDHLQTSFDIQNSIGFKRFLLLFAFKLWKDNPC